jgi:low temperature requirement protein LtrA
MMTDAGSWWRKPLLQTNEDERRASWRELFLDLVFVALIAQLSTRFAHDVTWAGGLRFVLLFLPAWSVWLSMTVYNDRFDTDDVSERLATLIIIITVAGMAVFAKGFSNPDFVGYAASFIAARAIIVWLWLRAGYHNPGARPVTSRYAAGFSVAIALWIAAVFAPVPIRIGLVASALVVDFATPGLTAPYQSLLPRLSSSHLPERFGLFVIIVLGESVVSVVAVLARMPMATFRASDVAATAFVIVFAFSLWWLYFDHVAENPPLPGFPRTWAFGLLHLPLMVSLTAVGAGTQAFIASNADGSPAITALIAASAAVTFATIGLLEYTTEPTAERKHPVKSGVVHISATVAAGLVALAAAVIPTLGALVVLLVLAVAQVVYGIGIRARHAHHDME